MKVLLVEDEQNIADFVCAGRAARGVTVTHCSDGNTGFARGSQEPFDTIVLGLMLPGRDGPSVTGPAGLGLAHGPASFF